ncbi:anthranilate synthase component 1 [Catenovulum adriaticum]|uniref:Anthranilate synthase component 1 n=1 Tax=Catenovulum adriaticum TaxID=2984846 RepID=A0ABY7AP47_9ALTE|nr:anthranilate synthase component 1 [Catenovulum sp. TS8]WAJ71003.1 anthranilate synthase component 1 [Catenovulum sp. TS8]
MKKQFTTTQVSTLYIADPLAVYSSLAKDHVHSLLLESAEIDSKDNLKSILVLDSCVRIECNAQQVDLVALNQNGQVVLDEISHHLSDYLIERTDNQVSFKFPLPIKDLTEDERLKTANPFQVLRSILQLNHVSKNATDKPQAPVFLGGVFGYDLIGVVEDLTQVEKGENTCPDYVFYLAETLLISDHQNQSAELIHYNFSTAEQHHADQVLADYKQQLSQLTSDQTPLTTTQLSLDDVRVDVSDQDFCESVESLKSHIKVGNIFQVVPSRTFSLPCPDSVAAYRKLKKQNPSPYMFYMRDQNFELFGASPESAVKYTQSSNEVEIYPIAGTRRRGFNDDGSINLDLDARIEQELRSDKKELAEHMMLVDLARNDVARVSEPGTRYVCDLQKVDRYSFVMHLVSRVKGQLRADLDALHAYQACLNMGTLVGAPKVKAADLIRQTEQKRRGSYGGAVGYLTSDGDMDTCIVIRSAFVANGTAHVQAGAGVVFDSVAQSEADETRSKAQAVLNAIISSQEA